MSYDHPKGSIKSVPCRTCGAKAGDMCRAGGPLSNPHSGRKADFRAFCRDLDEDLARLDERQAAALGQAAKGLTAGSGGIWWGRAGGKRSRLSASVVSELERWGALERTQGRGRELSLSPYGEQLLAGVGGA